MLSFILRFPNDSEIPPALVELVPGMFVCPGLPARARGLFGASELEGNSRPRGLSRGLVVDLPLKAATVGFTGRREVCSGLAEP